MKSKSKYIATVLLFLFFSFNSNADCVKRQCWKWNNGTPGTNGGPMTYGYIEENEAGTFLECKDAGTKTCKWKDGTIPPGIIISGTPVSWDEALQNAQAQVELNVTAGEVLGDNGSNYSWNFTGEVLQFEMNICTP